MHSSFVCLFLFQIVHVSIAEGEVAVDLAASTATLRRDRVTLTGLVNGLRAKADASDITSFEAALRDRNTALILKFTTLKRDAEKLGKDKEIFENHERQLALFTEALDQSIEDEKELVKTHNTAMNILRDKQGLYSKLAHIGHGKFSEFLYSKLISELRFCAPGAATPSFTSDFTDTSITKEEVNEIFIFLKSIEPAASSETLLAPLVKEAFRHAQLDPDTCLIKSTTEAVEIQRKKAFLYLEKNEPTLAIIMVREITCKLQNAVPPLGVLTIDDEIVKAVKNNADDYTKEGRFTFAVEEYDSIVSSIFSRVIKEKTVIEKKAKEGYVYSEAQIRCLVEKRVYERLGEVSAKLAISPNSILALVFASVIALVATLVAIKYIS